MYGINLVEVAKILGTAMAGRMLFSKQGAVHAICQQIIKSAAEKDIEMVKCMMRTLARQNEEAYHDIVKILQGHFTEQELQEILPT